MSHRPATWLAAVAIALSCGVGFYTFERGAPVSAPAIERPSHAPSYGFTSRDVERDQPVLPAESPDPCAPAGGPKQRTGYEQAPQLTASGDMPSQTEYDAESVRVLSASANAEHLAVVALLSDDLQTSLEFLDAASSKQPHNPVLRMIAAQLCRDAQDADCATIERRRRIDEWIHTDPSNAVAWLTLASHAADTGDDETHRAAVASAASAAEFNVYFADLLIMTDEALEAAGQPYPRRAWNAFTTAPVYMGRAGTALDACGSVESNADPQVDACLRISRTMATESATAIGQLLGIALELRLLQAANGTALERTKLKQRQAQLRVFLESRPDDLELALLRDERVFDSYVAELKAHGEMAATRLLMNEHRAAGKRSFGPRANVRCD